jgi:hypothetical protein
MEKYNIKLPVSSSITDKKVLTKYVSYFTLGDGCLRVQKSLNRPNKNLNAHFECCQVKEHEDYILWRADILSNITSVTVKDREVKIGKTQLKTQTQRHPFFTAIRNRLYLNNHKVIDPHTLKLLDWEGLAILYQDDGCLSKKPSGNNCYTLTISTESFSYGDNVLLQRAIKDKTDILFRINKTSSNDNIHYRLCLSKYELINQFVDGVSKYIKPSFEYKITFSERLAPEKDDDII